MRCELVLCRPQCAEGWSGARTRLIWSHEPCADGRAHSCFITHPGDRWTGRRNQPPRLWPVKPAAVPVTFSYSRPRGLLNQVCDVGVLGGQPRSHPVLSPLFQEEEGVTVKRNTRVVFIKGDVYDLLGGKKSIP